MRVRGILAEDHRPPYAPAQRRALRDRGRACVRGRRCRSLSVPDRASPCGHRAGADHRHDRLLGCLCVSAGHQYGQGLVGMSFAALYPALSILLAVIFLGESLTVRQGAGVVLALAAMLLIAL
ncbi:MAG TPA: EamA family transporter [Chloroflexi bacterium]|nr:EamA family transporter [Chloroflexota bacterium]